MVADQQVHPKLAELSAFAVGKLELAEVAAIETHLSGCTSCCESLKQIQDDAFVGLVRACGPLATEGGARWESADQTGPMLPELGETAEPSGARPRAFELPAELAGHPRYRVVELVGAGGMGAVYRAEHRLMQRSVALKVINPRFIRSAPAVERFRREVQAAARLAHPNIVHAYDAEHAGDVHFLVMEYVAGTDLGKVLEERGPLPVAEACDAIRQAALGLQHAHENGMVHRDIKPQNLMAVHARALSTASGSAAAAEGPRTMPQIKILDFGLASLTTEINANEPGEPSAPGGERSGLTQAGSLMGTPDFMAPEQGRDARSADIRSDIYSLGCTLYRLLTGKVPFPGGTAIDKVNAHAERTPPPVARLRPDVPRALIAIIDRMMAKDPAARYQSPAEVAEALAPLAQLPSAAGGRRGARRRGAVLALAAAAAALLFGIIYVATDNGRLVIDSKVDDVQVVVMRGGQEVEIIDLKSGSTVKRLPSGDYDIRLRGDRTDVMLDRGGFTMKRWGQEVVQVKKLEGAAAAPARPRRRLSGEEIAPKYRDAINKGLACLARLQRDDGRWEAVGGQYPVTMTALSGMAMLMEGSTLHDGKYAPALRKAVDWLIRQSQSNGLLTDPNSVGESGRYMFGHGYAMLFLATVYGLEDEGELRLTLEKTLTRAVGFSAKAQTFRGGWGYVAAADGGNFDEGATTIAQLQGLRAARNAGIDVPRRLIDAVYLRKCTTQRGGIVYSVTNADQSDRPPLTAAAIAVAEYDSELVKKWLQYCQQTLPLNAMDRRGHDEYTHFYYAQALYALGDEGYAKLFPESKPAERLTWSKYRAAMFDRIVSQQAADGSWGGGYIGPVYSTVCYLTVLQLDNGAIPIYRR